MPKMKSLLSILFFIGTAPLFSQVDLGAEATYSFTNSNVDVPGYLADNHKNVSSGNGSDFSLGLILDFKSECWIELYNDEKLLVAQNFEKDDQFTKEIAMPFKIIIGNADSVTGTYNNERIDFITNANRLNRVNTIYFSNEQLD